MGTTVLKTCVVCAHHFWSINAFPTTCPQLLKLTRITSFRDFPAMSLLLPRVVNCDIQALAQSALAANNSHSLTYMPMADMAQDVVALGCMAHPPDKEVFGNLPDILETCAGDVV